MRLRRIAALDGVRGFAVLAVLLYHGETRPLPGGFLGVEVFFVLTGFLVSSVFVGEARREGGVGLLRFWRRRAERLVPELAALVGAVLVYALLFEHDRVAGLRWEALSGLCFAANWHFIFASVPYFQQFDGPSLLLHLWSIGVEAQLYVLAAPLLALALRPRYRRSAAALVAALALGSALLAAALSFGASESRLYYGTDTRASSFLLGATLALLWQPSSPHGVITPLRAALPVLGATLSVAGLFAAFLFLDASSPALYRGGMLAVDLLSVVLIYSVAQADQSAVARALSVRPLTWLGERSYGIYLWHWPLFVVLAAADWAPVGGVALLVFESALAIGLAALSFRYVYRPGRAWMQGIGHGGELVRLHGRIRQTAVLSAALIAGSFVAAVAAVSPPGRPAYLQQSSFHGIVQPNEQPPTATPTATPTSTPSPTPALHVVLTATPAAPAPTATPIPPTPTPTQTPALLPSPLPQMHADVLALGDSVMVGAAGYGYMGVLGTVEVDAHEGRQMSEYVSIIRARAAAGTLPATVVIHAGNNGPFRASHLAAIMEALGGSRRVVFVNVRVNQPWQDETNATLATAPGEYGNVRVVDWYGATAGHPELFWDGMHVRPEGAQLYATLIAQALQ